MGSRQFTSRSGNGHANLSRSINISSINDYTLEDLKTYKVNRIQFGTNPLVNSIIIGENNNNNPHSDNYSAPPVIGFHQGIPGALANLVGIGKNNCVHCFCFLEVDELDDKDEGIIIEFGEYNYGDPNDFNVKTLYESKNGGLRLYVVKKRWFENYCSLARIKCLINKKEILEDILIGISKDDHKWRLEKYDRKKQNCHDFAAILLNYLEIQNYEICKGTLDQIPDKIKRVLNIE
jgi:hypothetical protein